MLKYTIKRLLVAIPTFFGITVLVYLISLLAPGSPLEMLMADPMATKESMEALKEQMGLNDPAIIQYFRWLVSMLHGNLGISYRNSLPVLGQVLEKLGPTLILTLSSTALSVLIAVSAWYHVSIQALLRMGLYFFRTGFCRCFYPDLLYRSGYDLHICGKAGSPSYGRYV